VGMLSVALLLGRNGKYIDYSENMRYNNLIKKHFLSGCDDDLISFGRLDQIKASSVTGLWAGLFIFMSTLLASFCFFVSSLH
jgi:hypothetical protein